jgi:hypothetical protein
MAAEEKTPKPARAPDPKEARLAKALRENLRRRKARAGEGAAEPGSDHKSS